MKFINKYGLVIFVLFGFCMFYKPIFCFLLLGLLMLFYSIHYIVFLFEIKKYGKETIGKIIFYEVEDEGNKTPFIEFEIDGKQIKDKPYYYSSTDISIFRTYENNINKSIPIIFLPKNPQKFMMKTEKIFNYFSLVFVIIVASVFIFIALAQLSGTIKISGME